VEIEISDEDAQLLRDVLGRVISDLSPEIADTDNPEYRRQLRDRRERLRAILTALNAPT